MNLDILCTPELTRKQTAWLESYAQREGITLEEAVRRAVAFFCDRCVPTRSERKAR